MKPICTRSMEEILSDLVPCVLGQTIEHKNKELLDAAWQAYILELKKIPQYNMYDRVSIHEAFPEVDRAFDAYRLLSKLLEKHDRQPD